MKLFFFGEIGPGNPAQAGEFTANPDLAHKVQKLIRIEQVKAEMLFHHTGEFSVAVLHRHCEVLGAERDQHAKIGFIEQLRPAFAG